MFGQPDLTAHRAGWLRQYGVKTGAAASPDRATAPMEQAQGDAVQCFQRVEDIDQGNFGLIKRPVAGEDAAVFVAVRVAEHDVLFAAATRQQRRHARQCKIVAHDLRCLL